ncbi:MAG: co-chaperone GroES family protein [Pseudomonadota bacterium]
MRIRAVQDNVIVRFLPEPGQTKSGLFLPKTAQVSRTGVKRAVVLAVGPGYYRDSGHGGFIPTTLKVGEVVLVDALAGQDYRFDLNVPRHNKSVEWADEQDGFRAVREDEVLAVIESE